MNQWKIRIVWCVDDDQTVQADAEFPATDGEDGPVIDAVLVAKALSEMHDLAMPRIMRMSDGYDERATTITLNANGRTRSIMVKDRMGMPSKEAEQCAHKIMDWLTGTEMERFLRPSS